MKKLLAVLLAVIMVLGLAACKPGDSGDKNKNKGEISVLYYSFSDAYISTVRTAMDKILTDGGYTFNDYDANGNQTTQTEQVQTALAKGCSMLIVNVVDTGSDDAAQNIINLAKAKNVILAEAMTIYHMPIYKKLNEIISSGQLGRLNLIQVNFGSYKDYNMTNRFFSRKLAGGALLDIGVYSLSLIRWFFKETPSHVLSQVRYAPTGVDEQAGILLMNDAAEMATVTLSLHSKQPKRATISFDKAYVEIFEYPRGMQATITYTEDCHKEVIDAGDTSDALYYEVCDMEKAVNSTSSDEIENLTHIQYTYDVMKIMSDIRAEWGMKYPEEE